MKIMIFDSICPLCSTNANFVIKNDATKTIHATSTQSELGQFLCRENNIDPSNPTTFAFIDENNIFTKSDAAIRIAKYLRFPFNILQAIGIIPKNIRDKLYDLIAKNRYKIFGKRKTCSIPNKEIRSRFIEKKSDITSTKKYRTIFEKILGDDYYKIPENLRRLHNGHETKTWTGTITVERSSNIIGHAIGFGIRLPEQMEQQPFKMTFHAEENGKSTWTRAFHKKSMNSQTEVKEEGHETLMLDTMWPVSIGLKITTSNNKIEYVGQTSYVFGIKIPSIFNPKITSSEESHADHIEFKVSISIPVIGTVCRYYGILYPPA